MSSDKIPRHPLYRPDMQKIHGAVPPLRPSESSIIFPSSLKRSLSADIEGESKRNKTKGDGYRSVYQGLEPKLPENWSIKYNECAKLHEKDDVTWRKEAEISHGNALTGEDGEPLPYRSWGRSHSHRELVRQLTPRMEEASIQAPHIPLDNGKVSIRGGNTSQASFDHDRYCSTQPRPIPKKPADLVS